MQSKTEHVTSEQPQDGSNTFAESEWDELVPITATKHGMCDLCKSYIEPREDIVSADGVDYVHASCARNAGWPVA